MSADCISSSIGQCYDSREESHQREIEEQPGSVRLHYIQNRQETGIAPLTVTFSASD